MSTKLKAENLKFLLLFNTTPISQCCCGCSLKQGYQIGLFLMIMIEVMYHVATYDKFRPDELFFLGLVLWSLVKCTIYIQTIYGISRSKFDNCYIGYILVIVFFWIQLSSSVLGIVLHFFDETLILVCIIPRLIYSMFPFEIYTSCSWLLFVNLMNLYFAHIGYSFTKKLGVNCCNTSEKETASASPLRTSLGYTPPNMRSNNISALTTSKSLRSSSEHNSTPNKGSESNTSGGKEETIHNHTNLDQSFILTRDSLLNIESDKVTLTSKKDILFARTAQDSIVNDSTFPSGLRIPSASYGKNWKIVGDDVLLV
jgi:hypothetical protein